MKNLVIALALGSIAVLTPAMPASAAPLPGSPVTITGPLPDGATAALVSMNKVDTKRNTGEFSGYVRTNGTRSQSSPSVTLTAYRCWVPGTTSSCPRWRTISVVNVDAVYNVRRTELRFDGEFGLVSGAYLYRVSAKPAIRVQQPIPYTSARFVGTTLNRKAVLRGNVLPW